MNYYKHLKVVLKDIICVLLMNLILELFILLEIKDSLIIKLGYGHMNIYWYTIKETMINIFKI